jgi:hypothetical protein
VLTLSHSEQCTKAKLGAPLEEGRRASPSPRRQSLLAATLLVPALHSTALATAVACTVTAGHLVHWSGFYQNYHDVGGPDTAIIFSVANTVANPSGVLIPLVADAF